MASCLVYLPSLLCWFLEVNPAGLYYLPHISQLPPRGVREKAEAEKEGRLTIVGPNQTTSLAKTLT